MSRKLLITIATLFLVIVQNEKTKAEIPYIQEIVSSVDGLSDLEKEQLTNLLTEKFSSIPSLSPPIKESVKSIISAGVFEQASLVSICDVAYKAYYAEVNGAPARYVEDLALVGFSRPITKEQLYKAALSIQKLIDHDIASSVVEELISYGIYNDWSGDTILKISEGVLAGVKKGLAEKKLVLSLIIGVDQEIDHKNVDQIVAESIAFLLSMKKQPSVDARRRNLAYQKLQEAISQGLPARIGEEIYFTAITEKWSPEAITAIFDGLVQGQKIGLTVEKLATAFIVRMAQNEANVSPQQIVTEETNYIKQIEHKKITLIKKDRQKYRRKLTPVNEDQNSYIQPPHPKKKRKQQYYPTTKRTQLNIELMKQTIEEFLGPPPTPYRWGGNTRHGIDCSGFVRAVYMEQGILLPRTSRQQSKAGIPVKDQLLFGDLVFFLKYSSSYWNRISHVGIYIGGGKFVHASCTRGVTISSLNQRYYKSRYWGARRIVY